MSQADDGGDANGDDRREHSVDDSTTAGAALVVFLFGELIAGVIYVFVSRPMWFFQDEWDFLANRTAGNIHDLFEAHNEHWVTLPALVYRALWGLFGLRTYRPYQLVIVLAHLGAALLLRTLMRRVGVRPWTATVVASILVFFGSGYQNIVLPFQITLVGSLVFGLAHLLLAGHDGPVDRRDYLGLLAGCAGLMCSGVGVSMVIAVGVAVLISRGWRVALLHTVPLGAVYLAWFAAIGHEGYTGRHGDVVDVAKFVRLISTATFDALGHFHGLGWVLAALLVVGLVLAWGPLSGPEFRSRAAAPLGLLVGVFALLCITGFGRAGLSPFYEKSRYLHLVTAMLLPALAVASDAIMRRWRAVAPVVVVVLLIGIPSNFNVLINYMNRPIVVNQRHYRRMMLSLPRVAAAREVPRDTVPERELAHFVTIGWLLDGVASGRIPKPRDIPPADEAMDTIRLSLAQSRARLSPGDVCTSLATSLVFHLERGQSILVRAIGKRTEITPATLAPGSAYPFFIITVAGPLMVAQRPVAFRITAVGVDYSQVCAQPRLIKAARAAAKRQ